MALACNRQTPTNCNTALSAENWFIDPFNDPCVCTDRVVKGDQANVQGYPDHAANYSLLTYSMDTTKGLRLSGLFAMARYENFNVDLYTAEGPNEEYLKTILLNDRDYQSEPPDESPDMVALSHACNPAFSSNPSTCTPRNYVVDVVDELWSETLPTDHNVLRVPRTVNGKNVARIRVLWRTYIDTAGTPVPPTVRWRNTSDVTVPAPSAVEPAQLPTGGGEPGLCDPCGGPFTHCSHGVVWPNCGDTVDIYSPEPAPGIAPNAASLYVTTNLTRRHSTDDVVVFRHRAPAAAEQYPSGPLLGSLAENMRYWSFCLGYKILSTKTVPDSCFYDDLRRIPNPPNEADNWVVVGPLSVASKAAQRLHNFIFWGASGNNTERILIYRNSLTSPNFAGSFEGLTTCDTDGSGSGTCQSVRQQLSQITGRDSTYAPRGKHCTKTEYLDDSLFLTNCAPPYP